MYLHIKITPKSKKEEIKEVDKEHFEVRIKEPAERNLANKRLIEILRERFPESKQIKIVSGHHSTSKLISVDIEEN